MVLALQLILRVSKAVILGAVIGALIGGLDAYMGGDSIIDGAIKGAQSGLLFGFILGIVTLSPVFGFAVTTTLGIAGTGIGFAGAAQSFSEGKIYQGIFRILLSFLGVLLMTSTLIAPKKASTPPNSSSKPSATNTADADGMGLNTSSDPTKNQLLVQEQLARLTNLSQFLDDVITICKWTDESGNGFYRLHEAWHGARLKRAFNIELKPGKDTSHDFIASKKLGKIEAKGPAGVKNVNHNPPEEIGQLVPLTGKARADSIKGLVGQAIKKVVFIDDEPSVLN